MRLDAEKLTFSYEGKPVLNSASLSVETGEVLFLLGPNGSGKTTLLKIMLGILRPLQGRILLDNIDISAWPQKKLAAHIGYVPQDHTPPFAFSVLEVVLMGRTPYLNSFTVPSREDLNITCNALETLGINHLKNRNYTAISGGERQLVLIARALAQQPEFLIMDEPTSNLDYSNQHMVLDHISRLARNGMGILVSSHVPDYALRYSTKAALMRDGTVVATGLSWDVINSESLRMLYGIHVKVADVLLEEERHTKVCVPL